jgi:hypothetical protein
LNSQGHVFNGDDLVPNSAAGAFNELILVWNFGVFALNSLVGVPNHGLGVLKWGGVVLQVEGVLRKHPPVVWN